MSGWSGLKHHKYKNALTLSCVAQRLNICSGASRKEEGEVEADRAVPEKAESSKPSLIHTATLLELHPSRGPAELPRGPRQGGLRALCSRGLAAGSPAGEQAEVSPAGPAGSRAGTRCPQLAAAPRALCRGRAGLLPHPRKGQHQDR